MSVAGGRFVSLFAMLAFLAGCPHVDPDRGVFACTADADCGPGWRCVDHACVNPADPPAGGPCLPACAGSGKACCKGACADLAGDRLNCGACGHACADGLSCIGGRCDRETHAGQCANGLDDDGDRLVDCADEADCPALTACAPGRQCCHGECRAEADDTLCANGVDDDCDGQVDCEDAGCKGRICAPGRVCGDHGCTPGCSIGRELVAPGVAHPASACRRCTPELDPRGWSFVAALGQVDGCRGSDACDGAGLCRRAPGQPCGGPGDCASHDCREGRCAR